MLAFPPTPLTGSDFAPNLQSQTLQAPEAGLSRTPLKPQCHSAARLPATAGGHPTQMQPSRAGPKSKGHFLRRTLLPSPTFPRAQLQKQLLASTLPTFPQRSVHQHLSAPPHSSSPRLGRETPPLSAACPSTHKTPQAIAARLHPIPWTVSPFNKYLVTPPTPGFTRTDPSIQRELVSKKAEINHCLCPHVFCTTCQQFVTSNHGRVWFQDAHTFGAYLFDTPPNCTHR